MSMYDESTSNPSGFGINGASPAVENDKRCKALAVPSTPTSRKVNPSPVPEQDTTPSPKGVWIVGGVVYHNLHDLDGMDA